MATSREGKARICNECSAVNGWKRVYFRVLGHYQTYVYGREGIRAARQQWKAQREVRGIGGFKKEAETTEDIS